jgi:hypothetical protein
LHANGSIPKEPQRRGKLSGSAEGTAAEQKTDDGHDDGDKAKVRGTDGGRKRREA